MKSNPIQPSIVWLIALTLVWFGPACSSDSGSNEYKAMKFKSAGEYEDSWDSYARAGGENSLDSTAAPTAVDDGSEQNASSDSSSESRDIVESDIFHVDGTTLYALNRYRGLYIVGTENPNSLEILGNVPFQGIPIEMYLYEGIAYVLLNPVQDYYYYGYSQPSSQLLAIDVSNPASPIMLNSFELDGEITDSRQVGEVIYVVSTGYGYFNSYCTDNSYNSRTLISSIRIGDPSDILLKDNQEFVSDSWGWTVYVSQKAMYVAQTGDQWSEGGQGSKITYLDITDPEGTIVKKGDFYAQGIISDRFWMHENGNLFAVASQNWSEMVAKMETFNISDPMNVVKRGEVTLIRNQEIKSAKYTGNRGYVVTFEQVDPLHVVDLSNPDNPTELGQLEIPGYSTYMEIINDHIIAPGEDSAQGGAKVSMYSVVDPTNPVEIDTVEIAEDGGYASSEANYDWKAFKIYTDLGLILMPSETYSTDYRNMAHRLTFISFDTDTESDNYGLRKRGHVDSRSAVRRGVRIDPYIASLSEMEIQLIDYQDPDNPHSLSRLVTANYVGRLEQCGDKLCDMGGAYYDNTLRIRSYDLAVSDFRPVFESEMLEAQAENFTDRASLLQGGDISYLISESYGHWDNMNGEWVSERTMAVHAFDLNGDSPEHLGVTRLELPSEENDSDTYYQWGSGLAATENGALAYLGVSYNWDGDDESAEGYLQFLNASDPTQVTLVENGRFNGFRSLFREYLNYSGYFYGGIDLVDDVAVAPRGMYYYDDYYYGSMPKPARLVSRGDKIYIPHCESAGRDDEGRPMLACFAVMFNAANPNSPARQGSVNVPGEVVGVSEDGRILYTRDRQWEEGEEEGCSYYSYWINVLSLGQDGAEIVARFELENSWSHYYEYGCDADDIADDGEDSTSSDPYETMTPATSGSTEKDSDNETSVEYDETDRVKEEPTAKLLAANVQYTTNDTTFVVQDKTLFLVAQQYLDYGDTVGVATLTNPCGEDTTEETQEDVVPYQQAIVTVIDAETGDTRATVSVPGGHDVTEVQGGGMLVRLTLDESNRVSTTRMHLMYIAPDGSTLEIDEPLTGIGGYYSFANGGVRQDNTLFISVGWGGILEVAL